jgi:hypothetical protein
MNKQVSVLAAIAILASGWVVWLSQSPSKDKFEASLLFDDLQVFATQIDSVEITDAQGVLFSAQKLGNQWLATFDPQQPTYPISQTKLANFVGTMMRAELVEAKTSKAQNYVRLGLQPVDIDDSMASLVILKASGNIWQVLVGNKVTTGEGHYILKPDDSRSWRTDKTINLPIDKFSWLKRPILPYAAMDISSISRVDNIGWHIARAANGEFQLTNMPTDKELEYDSILNSIVSSLTSLDFEQLLTIDENVVKFLEVKSRLEVITAEGTVFQVIVSEVDNKYFVNFISDGQSEYWQKWLYQVSYFSAQQLIKTLDDFLLEKSTTPATSDINIRPQSIEEGDSPN